MMGDKKYFGLTGYQMSENIHFYSSDPTETPTVVYKIPYRRAPCLACFVQPLDRVHRASKGILHTTPTEVTNRAKSKFEPKVL